MSSGSALCVLVFDALSVPLVVIWLERDYVNRPGHSCWSVSNKAGAERALARSILRDTPPIRATMRRRRGPSTAMGFASLVETLASRRIFEQHRRPF